MIASLAETIATAAIAVVDLAIERWRESAAFRAAKLQAMIELDAAARRRHGKAPRPRRVWHWRWRQAKATAIAQGLTKAQCDCLEAEVSRRVAAVVQAAVDAARG